MLSPTRTARKSLDLERLAMEMLNAETLIVITLVVTAFAFASDSIISGRMLGRSSLQPSLFDSEYPGIGQFGSFNLSINDLADQVVQLAKEVERANERGQLLQEKEESIERQLWEQREATEAEHKLALDMKAHEEELEREIAKQQNETKRIREELIERAKTNIEDIEVARTRGGAARRHEKIVQDGLRNQAHEMAQAIRRLSKEEVVRRFGAKQRRVRFDLRFPVDSASYLEGEEFSSFTIEMAPLDLVPHAINVFLSQVEAKLWDGCLFRQAPPWSLLGEPWNPTEGKVREEMFRERDLHHLSIPEYNPEYPHEQYKVAFYGEPGKAKGPAFYIKSKDNEVVDDGEDVDPCFAKIVEGEEVMMRAWRGEKREDKIVLRDPVTILKASILPHEED